MSTFPVVASILSQTELGKFVIAQYGLTTNAVCKLFRTGMNHTYFISNPEKTYVIRLYSHNWRSKSEITEEITLLNFLKKRNLNVSYPIADINGAFIQEINAPEGTRHLVLFSFAKGEKIRFLGEETCFSIGALMANIHNEASTLTINRTCYDKKTLIDTPYDHLKQFFSEKLPEMAFIKEIGGYFQEADFDNTSNGIVHLDIWYDNMAVTEKNDITIFDFDFCGNGTQILDVGYFCKQLFHIESDKDTYESKVNRFLEGYQTIRALSTEELKLIPKAGLAVYVFYLGVQAQRFDWSNIFLSENYLKMFYIERLKSWIAYNNMEKIS